MLRHKVDPLRIEWGTDNDGRDVIYRLSGAQQLAIVIAWHAGQDGAVVAFGATTGIRSATVWALEEHGMLDVAGIGGGGDTFELSPKGWDIAEAVMAAFPPSWSERIGRQVKNKPAASEAQVLRFDDAGQASWF